MLREVGDSVPGAAASGHLTGALSGQPRSGGGAEEHTRYEPSHGVEEQVAV